MRTCFSIFVLILSLVITGCRASKESKTRSERTAAAVAALELRRVDSLWSSLVERLTCKIEFYPPTGLSNYIQNEQESLAKLETGSPLPTAPSSTMPATGVGTASPTGCFGGGMGAVKSIEIVTERGTSTGSVTAVDSASRAENHGTEVRQTEKASEARQDNGTVIGVAIVLAVALLVYLLLKEALKP